MLILVYMQRVKTGTSNGVISAGDVVETLLGGKETEGAGSEIEVAPVD